MAFDIKIMDSTMLEYLKEPQFIQDNLYKFSNFDSNDWIIETCPYSPFIDTKYNNLPDIVLDMSAEKGKEYKTEFNNVKKIYSSLKFLTDSNASDERLWAALCLGPFYQYVQYRWGNSLKKENGVLQHFFFERPNRRSLTRNAISRLWWVGRLTYDKNREDPFELTEFVCSKSDNIMHFIERNTSNNINIMRPFLEAIIEENKKGADLNTDDYGELSKYLNLLGGMYILDVMPEEWIKSKIVWKIQQIVARKNNQNEESEQNTVKDNKGKRVNLGSMVIAECKEDGEILRLKPKKMKYSTIPKSIIGLKIGDKITIKKRKFTIIEIK